MPPAGQTKPVVVPRLSDRVAIGALTQTYPPGLVDQVLAECGRRERRHRLLPARMVVYHLLAMCLFADVAYVEVLRLLVEALRRPGRLVGAPARLPVKSALIQARARLGPEPLQVLFAQTARPLATKATQGAWYRRWRLMAIDGSCLDVADTPANQAWFGRPRSGRGEGVGAFPKPRVSGWPWAAPTPSSGRRWAPTPRARPPWPQRSWTPWTRGCWCWPIGCCRRGAVAQGASQRRGAAVAGHHRHQDRPGAAGGSGAGRRAVGCHALTPTRWWAPRSWSGCWSTPSTIQAARRRPGSSTGW